MRSVVVVLPASMCAMMPMLRSLESSTVRAIYEIADGFADETVTGTKKEPYRARTRLLPPGRLFPYVVSASTVRQRPVRALPTAAKPKHRHVCTRPRDVRR